MRSSWFGVSAPSWGRRGWGAWVVKKWEFRCLQLLAFHELEDNPLKTLVVVNHIGNKLLLGLSVSLWNILIKSLMTTTNLNHWDSSLQLTILSVWSNQVKFISDVNDWNGDVQLINDCSNLILKHVILSWLEWNRNFSK